MKSRLTVSFGEVADRERKHPGEGAFGHLSASGKEASWIRGAARVHGRKVARAFLGRMTLGPGPFGAIGLGRLARGTEPRPMVPTMPPFFLPGGGGGSFPIGKRTSLTVILWGTVDHQCCLIST